MRNFFYVIVITALSGCATNPLQGARFWVIEQCSNASAPRVNFPNSDGGTLATVSREHCSIMKRAVEKIGFQTSFQVENLYIASVKDLNAFATHGRDGKRTVIVTMGMLEALGSDEEAWAGLFGHEIAHLVKRHGEGRAEAKAGAQAGGQAIGNVIAQLMPGVGGFIAGNTANFVVANAMYGAYTRPQEAEADDLGLQAMVAAGYDPRGMRRLFEVLRKQGGLPAFLSTHPGAEDRMEVVERFIAARPSLATASSSQAQQRLRESNVAMAKTPIDAAKGSSGDAKTLKWRGMTFKEEGHGVRVSDVNSSELATLQVGDLLKSCYHNAAPIKSIADLIGCRDISPSSMVILYIFRPNSPYSPELAVVRDSAQ